MNEHDDDLESEAREDAEEERDAYPDTGDDLAEASDDDEDDLDEPTLDDDDTEL
jgi:hypothetical protein